MEIIKNSINYISRPTVLFTVVIATFFFVFPPNNWFMKVNRKLGIHKIWSNKGGIVLFSVLLAFFLFGGLTDRNFQLIIFKPDNVPIIGLIFGVTFFLWLSMKQAYENDERIANNEPVDEYHDPEDKVLVWPDLIYVEFIALILCSVFLTIWGIVLKAPLEEPANLADSPNPSKAPWYFLGLQEMLVYYDPWIAGVVFPTLIIVGLMAIPYIDLNPKGSGYYSYAERKAEISIFMFGWLGMWVVMIIIGTFLRGPNWNFFGPFQYWDPHLLPALTNVNLSEYVWVKWLEQGLPKNIIKREIFGFLLIGGYFAFLPPILTLTVFKKYFEKLGTARYSVFLVLVLSLASLPAKMYLRWLFNLKYLVAIPEYFFNI